MKNQIRYLDSFSRDIISKKLVGKIIPDRDGQTSLFKHKVPDYEVGGEIIASYLERGRPFSLIRPGMVEIRDCAIWEEKQLFGRELYQRKDLAENGFNSANREQFEEIFRNSFRNANIVAAFSNMPIEEYFIDAYSDNADVIWDVSIEPFMAKKPWTQSLKGKKVLVVSPFARYIPDQFRRIKEIYSGLDLFPEDIEILAVNSVWYLKEGDSGFGSWLEAMNYLKDLILKQDFDVALLSCGAFAIALADEIKKSGRSAIQYAGSLQMLFGIMGERWEDSAMYKPYFENNDSWIRVKPDMVNISTQNANELDAGCYW